MNKTVSYIKRFRMSLGISTKQLSELAGVGYSTLRDLEAGKITNPRPYTTDRLLLALETHLEAEREIPDPEMLNVIYAALSEGLGHVGRFTLPAEREQVARLIARDIKAQRA